MNIVILGLSITSAWGNGHATTYRGLVRELARRGHDVLFLERDMPWYAGNRDLPHPPYGRTALYSDIAELQNTHGQMVREADCIIVGSYVPEGIDVGRWVQATARGVTAFYDIDTPVTLAALARGDCAYLSPDLIPHYDLYLSFAGGPVLDTLEREYGSPRARPLYCSVDPELYFFEKRETLWDLGYLGTYSDDRQPALTRLMLDAARAWPEGRFCVAGPQYPADIVWPANVARIEHLPPSEHRAWYNAQRFTLNLTRADMVRTGYSPSVRLFEAAACGVPLLSDWWEGLDTFFAPYLDILIMHSIEDTLRALRETPDAERNPLGDAGPRAGAGGAHGGAPGGGTRTAYHPLTRPPAFLIPRCGGTLRSKEGVPTALRQSHTRTLRTVTGQTRIERLGEWFHNIHLPGGTQTAPQHRFGDFPAWKWAEIAPHIPEDLAGWRALDIGCNGGFYSFALARRGAQVLGIDVDSRYLTQARWAALQLGLQDQVTFRQMQVYDLARLSETFDLVLFMGVLYHLRYPLLALDLVAQKTDRLLVFQTLTMPGDTVREDTWDRHIHERDDLLGPDWPKMAFLEHSFAGDPTNWWAANRAGVEAMLRSSGMQVLSRPGHEMWLCAPDPERPSCVATWDADELRAATGRQAGRVQTFTFQHCWVNSSPNWTETAYHDGTKVAAMPEDSDHYSRLAAEMGYGADTARMSREHEILHTFLAEALGYGSSPTLWAVAHGQTGPVAPVWEQQQEEEWVLAFQTYLNGGPLTPPLERLAAGGLNVEELRAEALLLLRS